MITLIVKYTVMPQKRKEFIDRLNALQIAEKSRKECGCCGYDYYLSVENDNELLLVERWQDEQKWKEHTYSSHFQDLGREKSNYVQSTAVTRLTD